jgi:hypothetical protein
VFFEAKAQSHLSLASSWAEGRLSGSKFKILLSKRFASKSVVSGIRNMHREIFENRSFSLFPTNGCLPVSIKKAIIPRAHISVLNPQYSFLWQSSGAMYEAVPQRVYNFSPG